MGKTFNIYALSAISLALLSVYPAAQAADPIRITGQTEYSRAYKSVPVTVETGGVSYTAQMAKPRWSFRGAVTKLHHRY